MTDPERPWTWNGREWARPHPHSQLPHPRRISTTSSLARSIARRTDLASLRATEADEPVAVADHDRDRELEPATGIGHPLDHIDVQDLVVEPGEELVDDLGLTEG